MYHLLLCVFLFTETCGTVHQVASKTCYWLGMLIQFRLYPFLYPAASNLVTRFLFCFSSGAGRKRGESGVGGREREREEREQQERGWTVKRIIFYFFTLIDAPKTLRLARKTRVTLVHNRDLPAFTRVFPRCMYVM